ncbi:MAG: T9SS type A sorting domain-containing protein [Bacteroidia bacterium]
MFSLKKKWNKPVLLILITLGSTAGSWAQKLEPVWSHLIGGEYSGTNSCEIMKTDSHGNLFSIGAFTGYLDFDQGPGEALVSANTGDCMFITKHNSKGKLLWVNKLNAEFDDVQPKLLIDNSGNAIIIGSYDKNMAFDKDNAYAPITNSNVKFPHVFMIKYNTHGQPLWNKQIIGTFSILASDAAIDHQNSIIIAGNLQDSVDFDTSLDTLIGHSLGNDNDFFLAKYDSSGSVTWAHNFQSTRYDVCHSLGVDKLGNIIVNGRYSDSLDFDPSTTTAMLKPHNGHSNFLAKYEPNGNYLWAKNMAGNYESKTLLATKQGSFYMFGNFRDSFDFDLSTRAYNIGSNGKQDIFIAKFTTNGDLTWAKSIGSVSNESAKTISCDSLSNLYLLGRFADPLMLDSNNLSTSYKPQNGPLLIAKFDSTGQHAWSFQLGSDGLEQGKALATSINGDVWIGGSFNLATDFDPSNKRAVLITEDSSRYQHAFLAQYLQATGAYKTAWQFDNMKGYGTIQQNFLRTDKNGNLYLAGISRGKIDFDQLPITPRHQSLSLHEPFLAKYDSMGYLQWLKTFGNNNDLQTIADVHIDFNNDIYLSGVFDDSIRLNPNINHYTKSKHRKGGFLIKLSADGNYLWGHVYDGIGSLAPLNLCVDSNQNLYATGAFTYSIEMNDSNAQFAFATKDSRHSSTFINKFNAKGDLLWAKKIGAQGPHKVHSTQMLLTEKNGFILSGYYSGGVDFNPGTGIDTLNYIVDWSDIFIAKYDSSGGFKWVKGIHGKDHNFLQSLEQDDAGNLYMSGRYEDHLILDSLHNNGTLNTINEDHCGFIAKYNKRGKFIWAKKIGDPNNWIYNLKLTEDKGIVKVIGSSMNELHFYSNSVADTSIYSKQWTLFMAEYDTTGTIITATNFPSVRSGVVDFVSNSNKTTILGYFEESLDLHQTGHEPSFLYPRGNRQHFMAQLGPKGACKSIHSSLVVNNVCDSFKAPSGKVYKNSGIYTDSLKSIGGCDSLVFIALKLNTDVQKISAQACYSFTSPSGKHTYKTSGFYYDTLKNASGCDSIIEINLIIKSNIDTVKANSCGAYKSPSGNYIYSATGIYIDTILQQNSCDSIITTDLTITTIDTSLSVTKKYLKANALNADYQWLDCNNNTKIDSANKAEYYPLKTGNYAVAITKNGCTDTSACIKHIHFVSSQTLERHEIKVFPNPAKNRFSISNGQEGSWSLTIYNAHAKKVYTRSNLTYNSIEVMCANWSPGLYFVEVSSAQGLSVGQFVKE